MTIIIHFFTAHLWTYPPEQSHTHSSLTWVRCAHGSTSLNWLTFWNGR